MLKTLQDVFMIIILATLGFTVLMLFIASLIVYIKEKRNDRTK